MSACNVNKVTGKFAYKVQMALLAWSSSVHILLEGKCLVIGEYNKIASLQHVLEIFYPEVDGQQLPVVC